ncbi:unnamed protein product [[Actinomadura] parvosata subsp. kistnae]|nr:unnamed protein product [Actinomadura parvosata subsp. kistnae]
MDLPPLRGCYSFQRGANWPRHPAEQSPTFGWLQPRGWTRAESWSKLAGLPRREASPEAPGSGGLTRIVRIW